MNLTAPEPDFYAQLIAVPACDFQPGLIVNAQIPGSDRTYTLARLDAPAGSGHEQADTLLARFGYARTGDWHRADGGFERAHVRPAGARGEPRALAPHEDLALRFHPAETAVGHALALLGAEPHADLAAIPMTLPGKSYGIWVTGQDVRTVPGVIFIGTNRAGNQAVPDVPDCSWARDAAAQIAEHYLDGPGTVAYAIVRRDGSVAVFEEIPRAGRTQSLTMLGTTIRHRTGAPMATMKERETTDWYAVPPPAEPWQYVIDSYADVAYRRRPGAAETPARLVADRSPGSVRWYLS